MVKKLIILAAMTVCASMMIACSDNSSSASGYCSCYAKSMYVNSSQMNSTAASIDSEEGCKQYDHGSGGYFACDWIRY